VKDRRVADIAGHAVGSTEGAAPGDGLILRNDGAERLDVSRSAQRLEVRREIVERRSRFRLGWLPTATGNGER
jgi:hypothetical protein